MPDIRRLVEQTNFSETEPCAPAETIRVSSRKRVLKSGVVAFNGRHSTLPCTVRDLSDTGARLRSEGCINIPDTFELLLDLDGLEADCVVVWRKGNDVGVNFQGEPRKVAPTRKQVVSVVVPGERPSLRRKPR